MEDQTGAGARSAAWIEASQQPSVVVFSGVRGIVLLALDDLAIIKVYEGGAPRNIEFSIDIFYKDNERISSNLSDVLSQGDEVTVDYMVGWMGRDEVVHCSLVWQGEKPQNTLRLDPQDFANGLIEEPAGFDGASFDEPGFEEPGFEGHGFEGHDFDEAGYGFDEAGYGFDEAGYGFDEAGYGFDEAGYGFDEPGYGFDDSGYGFDEPDYGLDEPGYDFDEPGYGFDEPGYGFDEPGYGGIGYGGDGHDDFVSYAQQGTEPVGEPPMWHCSCCHGNTDVVPFESMEAPVNLAGGAHGGVHLIDEETFRRLTNIVIEEIRRIFQEIGPVLQEEIGEVLRQFHQGHRRIEYRDVGTQTDDDSLPPDHQ